jgi:hypothetical protein
MPFYRLNGMTVHMKGTKLPAPCAAQVGIGGRQHVCMDISGFLCDWPAGGGRTCDLALCEAHAHQVSRNRHYCPAHFADHTDFQAQRGLFTGLIEGAAP